jgi:hypothetical protein
MEMLIEKGFAGVFRVLLNEAMKIERDNVPGARFYERTDARRSYASSPKADKLRTVDTYMGMFSLDIPQIRGDVDFYPLTESRNSGLARKGSLCADFEINRKGITIIRTHFATPENPRFSYL